MVGVRGMMMMDWGLQRHDKKSGESLCLEPSWFKVLVIKLYGSFGRCRVAGVSSWIGCTGRPVPQSPFPRW